MPRISNRLLAAVLIAAAFALASDSFLLGSEQKAAAKDDAYHRPIQDMTRWERAGGDLLWGFWNLYQPCVVELPVQEYRYRMWFFGWSVADSNPGYPGSDAIFHARSKDLKQWEVYAGTDRWDRQMQPKLWVPIVTADEKPFDAWHNGDPSVVYRDGRYYMAFSATGKPGGVKYHPNDMLCCVMGATSGDGIHWQKTEQPLLIESPEAQNPPSRQGWTGDFHRPSLLWDQGKWRLWFDYWHPTQGVCMGYAENTGDFRAAGGFRILRAGTNPLLVNWPNPEVVKIGPRYHAFADPVGYPPKRGDKNEGWTSRAICEAVSEDGLNWQVVGFLTPDRDAAACHVPQALVTKIDGKSWLYLFYATQRGGQPEYNFRYDRIRAMRRPVADVEAGPGR
jgi:hypothetical protein